MKYKLLFAVILLLVLLAGGILLEVAATRVFTRFSEKTHAILQDGPDAEYDIKDINELHEYWREKHKYLEIYLPHVQLNEVEVILGELVGAVMAEDYPTSSALINRLYETGNALIDMYSFKIGNVL
jgi:hypothetical protein